MRLRLKSTGQECFSGEFNVHGLGEIIVGFDDGGMDSDFITNYDVWLEARREWKDLAQSLRDHDVIRDNYNTRFFEPETDEDRKRGYTL